MYDLIILELKHINMLYKNVRKLIRQIEQFRKDRFRVTPLFDETDLSLCEILSEGIEHELYEIFTQKHRIIYLWMTLGDSIYYDNQKLRIIHLLTLMHSGLERIDYEYKIDRTNDPNCVGIIKKRPMGLFTDQGFT